MTADDVLDFWFADETQPKWFQSTPEFDNLIRERFGGLYQEAASGGLDGWMESPRSALARIIVLDQFSRNLFRNDPRAFATDGLAVAAAHDAVDRGFDAALTAEERKFLYMPFMHSENLADQDRGLPLFASLDDAETIDSARHHRDIIVRFGRFPHRNAVLGRGSTAAETASGEIANPF